MLSRASANSVETTAIDIATVDGWLRKYSLLLLLLTISAWAIAAVQNNTLLYVPNERFTDLILFLGKSKSLLGNGERIFATPPQMNYPAPSLFVYSFFANMPVDAIALFIALIVAAAVAGMASLIGNLERYGIRKSTAWILGLTSLVTSYPLMLEIDRANIEGVVWILLMIGTLLFAKGRYLSSAILIALAGSIKPFPLCLFALFLFGRHLKEIVAGVLTWLGVNVSSFAFTGPTLARSFSAYQHGTRVYNQSIGGTYQGLALNFDHSVLALLKQIVRVLMGWPHPTVVAPIIEHLYLPYFVSLCVAGLTYIMALRRRPLLNQAIGLFTLLVLLPPAAYDYTLIHLYIPWAVFVLYLCSRAADGQLTLSPQVIWTTLVLFALLFTPQTFLRTQYIGAGGQLKCLFLLAIIIISLLAFFETSKSRSESIKQAAWQDPPKNAGHSAF